MSDTYRERAADAIRRADSYWELSGGYETTGKEWDEYCAESLAEVRDEELAQARTERDQVLDEVIRSRARLAKAIAVYDSWNSCDSAALPDCRTNAPSSNTPLVNRHHPEPVTHPVGVLCAWCRTEWPCEVRRTVDEALQRARPLEVLRQQHLTHDRILHILETADGTWDDETGDGPADPLYLTHLTDAVTKATGGES